MRCQVFGFFLMVLVSAGFAENEESKLKEIFTNMYHVVYGEQLMDTITCDEVTPSSFQLLLYTRTNNITEKPVIVNMLDPQIDVTKDLVFVSHGWVQSAYGYGVPAIKDEYLKRSDCNVITVNWEKLALQMYSTSVCQLPKIGKEISKMICKLADKGLKTENIHFIGHSLGGQLAGYVGYYTNETCGQKIGRITGLDPAGPLFVDTPRSNRLDSTDANFVQVIHTNGGGLGYYGKCGHADFFVNCGSIQGSCKLEESIYKVINLLPAPINTLTAAFCYHMRALDLWIEAVNSESFKAIPCSYCPIGCPPIFSFSSARTIMGETCPKTAKGGYYISTNSAPPYASESLSYFG